MKTINRLLLFLLPIIIFGCIEPFDVSVPGGNNALVVEGLVTDGPGPYQVKLSRSSLLDENIFPPEEGALVGIREEGGDIEILNEVEPGVYETQSMQAVAGKSYQLLVTLNDGRAYNTQPILLKSSPPVERVYAEFQENFVNEELKQGYQFYVDSRDPENSTRFYRYEWTESWLYAVPYPVFANYGGNDQVIPILGDPNSRCWTFEEFSGINIANSTSNSEDIVSRQPLLFVPGDPEKLKIRYGLQVRQYALTDEEYQFWEGLQQTSTESGTLFDAQPQALTSNLRSVDNPGEAVFGYFSVSGVSTGAGFVDFSEVPFGIPDLYTEFCQGEFVDVPNGPDAEFLIQQKLNEGLLFYELILPLIYVPPPPILGYRFITPFCGDCKSRGGTIEMPDWWIE